MAKEHTTKSGTKLPLLSLKGKPYLQVAHRLVWFTEENPYYAITTQFLVQEDDQAVCKATIRILTPPGNAELGTQVIKEVTAIKSETAKGFADFLEKAETGSIGRALALLGYGTQFTGDEFDEGNRLADSPISPAKKSGGLKSKGSVTKLETVKKSGGLKSSVKVESAPDTHTAPKGFQTRTKSKT